MLCATAVSIRRNRLCTSCFRNEQTLTSIESDDLTTKRFLLTCRNLFILFILQASIYSFFSFAMSDDLTSTYKSSYARSSSFQLLDELDTSWQWIISSLWSNTCERRIDINTDMNEFSYRITRLICYSFIHSREWESILNLTCAKTLIVNYYTRWVNWFSRILSIKKAIRDRTDASSRQLTSLSSRMKKKRRRLMCESQKTQKTFRRRCTKDCFIVQCCEMIRSNLCWLFRYDSRSQHDMYENMKSLFANSVLLLLTIALVNHVFQNYETFEEIEVISLSANEFLNHLRIKNDMLRVSFFQIISADELIEKIHEANSFSNRTVDLRHRVEYEKNIEIHDIQRKVLVKADDKFFRTRYLRWDTLILLKIMITRLLKEWNSSITTMQILSSTRTRLSWALLTKWSVTEIKNVVSFILKNFANYHFMIILSCCSRYSRKWKLIWITASTSSLSTRRSKRWERSFEKSQ